MPDLRGACIGRIVFEKRGELLRNVVSEFIWIFSELFELNYLFKVYFFRFLPKYFWITYFLLIFCISRIVFEKRGEVLRNVVHESCEGGRHELGRS